MRYIEIRIIEVAIYLIDEIEGCEVFVNSSIVLCHSVILSIHSIGLRVASFGRGSVNWGRIQSK